jgi:hypothetical protein
MRRKQTVAGHYSPAPRLAWCASFFAILALIALLGVAKSGQALTIPPTRGAEAVASGGEGEGEDGEEEQSEAEECEEDEVGDEGEEAEEGCGSKGQGSPTAPRACPLSSAKATVFVLSKRDKVRLQIGYTTTRPTAVAVAYGLHGGRGSLELGGGKKRFANQGVLRLTKSLTAAQMAKVLAARGFTVRIRVLATPPNCHSVFVRQLTVKRATSGGATWLQSK